MKPRSLFVICLLIFLGAFLIRHEYVMETEVVNPVRADAEQYLSYGYNLFKHGVYSKQSAEDVSELSPDSFRSPGYPLLIAASFSLGGEEYFYAVLLFLQVFLSSITAVLTLWLAWRVLSPPWAVISAVLVALSPHLVVMCGYMLTETLFSFLIVSALLFYTEAHAQKKLYLFVISSIFWGLAYLTNETVLFIPFCLALISWFLIRREKFSANIDYRWVAAFIILFTVFPISWMTRNHFAVPEDAPHGSSRALNTITHGSYIDFIYESEEYRYFPYYEDPMQPDISNSYSKFLEVFRQRFNERPGEYITWYLVKKPYYFWSWNILQGQGDIYVYPVKTSLYTQSRMADAARDFFRFMHPLIMIFFLGGLIYLFGKVFESGNTGIRQKFVFASLGWIPVYYTLLYMVFAPWPRYALPLRPLFFIIAVLALSRLFFFCKSRLERAGYVGNILNFNRKKSEN